MLSVFNFGKKKLAKHIFVSTGLYKEIAKITLRYQEMDRQDVLWRIRHSCPESMLNPSYLVSEYLELFPVDFMNLPFLKIYLTDYLCKVKFIEYSKQIDQCKTTKAAFENCIIFAYLQELIKEIPDLVELKTNKLDNSSTLTDFQHDLLYAYDSLFIKTKESLIDAIERIQDTERLLKDSQAIEDIVSIPNLLRLDLNNPSQIELIYETYNTYFLGPEDHHFLEVKENQVVSPTVGFVKKIIYLKKLVTYRNLEKSSDVLEYNHLKKDLGMFPVVQDNFSYALAGEPTDLW
jgi:hypothetical protein